MARKIISDELIRDLRNKVSVRLVAEEVCGCVCKEIEGYVRFICPICREMQTSIHPRENLGRCFRCEKNFNPIDFVMISLKYSFLDTVMCLKKYLRMLFQERV